MQRIRSIVIRSVAVAGVGVALVSCSGGGGASSTTGSTYDPKLQGPTGLATRLTAVKAALTANPPNTAVGGAANAARRVAITDWDSMLWSVCVCGNAGADINAYVKSQWDKAAAEMAAPVTDGVKIWAFYNTGFIVKSPTKTVAFDVVLDRPAPATDNPNKTFGYDLPASIVNQIDVLMISHEHYDHTGVPGHELAASVKARGAPVLYPRNGATSFASATVLVDSGATYQLNGVTVKAWKQVHGTVPTMAYEVTLPNGYRILHMDTEYSQPVESIKNIDILFINDWVNGATGVCKDAIVSYMQRLKPGITIPGHMQELSHDALGSGTCKPGENGAYRKTYADMLDLQDTNIGYPFALLTWGESIAFKKP